MEFWCKFYKEQKWTDIEFYFGDNKDKKIATHRAIISNASPVFEAMCFGNIKEESSIHIIDIEMGCFREMLRFIYTGEVQLNKTNVMGVLHSANKYMIPSLETKCTEFISTMLTFENVLWYLDNIPGLIIENKLNKADKILQQHTKEALKTVNISLDTITLVLKQSQLSIEEMELFEFVIKWAEQKCIDTGLSATSENQRKMLGEKATKLIRFPSMDLKEFVICIDKHSGFLSDAEFREICTDIVKCTSKSGFDKIKRSGYIRKHNCSLCFEIFKKNFYTCINCINCQICSKHPSTYYCNCSNQTFSFTSGTFGYGPSTFGFCE